MFCQPPHPAKVASRNPPSGSLSAGASSLPLRSQGTSVLIKFSASKKSGIRDQRVLMPSSRIGTRSVNLGTTAGSTAPPESEKRAVVVGGGPCGALTALYLARDGWKVTVSETREASAATAVSLGAEYNVILTERAFTALEGAGVPIHTLPDTITVEATVTHRNKEKPPTQRKPFSPGMVSIGRADLARSIHDIAMREHGGAIDWRWGSASVGLDSVEQKVALANGETVPFDLLVIADGVHSPMRSLLASQSGFQFQQESNINQYKGFVMPIPAPNGVKTKWDWNKSIHAWSLNPKCTIVSAPKPGGVLGAVIIMNRTDTVWNWDKIKTPDDVQNMFTTCFPSAFDGQPVPPEVVKTLIEAPPRGGGFTTVCDSLHAGGNIVLIGDAAHSMIPSLGQGCNSALESAAALAAAIRGVSGKDLSAALAGFSATRKPDTDAIQRMSNGLEKVTSGSGEESRVAFFFRFAVVLLLSKIVPFLVAPPAMMRLGDPAVPFARIEAQMREEKTIVKRFVAILAATILALPISFLVRRALLSV